VMMKALWEAQLCYSVSLFLLPPLFSNFWLQFITKFRVRVLQLRKEKSWLSWFEKLSPNLRKKTNDEGGEK
jgi:hypothetical protein